MDSPSFGIRERAYKALKDLGLQAEPQIKKAMEGQTSLEVKERLRTIHKSFEGPTTNELRAIRALEVLEFIDTPASRDVLRSLAEDKAGGRLVREARESFERLENRDARATARAVPK